MLSMRPLGANPYQKKILVRLSALAVLLISMGAEGTVTSAPDLFCDCPGPRGSLTAPATASGRGDLPRHARLGGQERLIRAL